MNVIDQNTFQPASDTPAPIPETAYGFTDAFLAALGAWQKGWRQDPALRLPLAAALKREAAKLDPRFRRCDAICYRKRFLYADAGGRELIPLFFGGALDEGSATSWTTDREVAKNLFGLWRPGAVTGAIFRHMPAPAEVVLNTPALWECSEFVVAATAYRQAGGPDADAIFHFRGAKDQKEIVLRAPLRLDGIVAFSGRGSVFDDVCAQAGITDPAKRDEAYQALISRGIYPEEPTYVFDGNADNVIRNTCSKLILRMLGLVAQ
jgi:hypothetical protein